MDTLGQTTKQDDAELIQRLEEMCVVKCENVLFGLA